MSFKDYFAGRVDDHRVLSNRSKAFIAVGNLSEALKDAERCCTLRPYWPKVCVCMHTSNIANILLSSNVLLMEFLSFLVAEVMMSSCHIVLYVFYACIVYVMSPCLFGFPLHT